MQSFYCSTVESVLTYSITVWYAGLTAEDRTALMGCNKIEHIRSSAAPCPPRRTLPTLRHSIGQKRSYMTQPTLDRVLRQRTSRFRNTFYLWAIRLLNKNM